MAVKTPTQNCINIAAAADTGGAGGTLLVKASKLASQANHRLYRQTRNYHLKFDLITDSVSSDDEVTYKFYTLPNTWFVHGAIEYAYRTYMQSHQDEMHAGVRFARWHDFTIDEQDPDGTWEQAQALMFDGDGWAGLTSDESPVDTQITLSDGSTTKQFRLMGTDSAAFNIFDEYANLLKYRQPTDPSVSSDQPYDGLLDLKDADKMVEVGDRPPYDSDFSSMLDDGSDDQNILVLQDSLTFARKSGSGTRTSTRVITAPLGLVYITKIVDGSASDVSNTSPSLCMHLSPGKYKGIKAPSIL